ncbi:MAG TPA: PxKF domain-containing protein, partial [Actinomycetota bacterium]|nr:PxKF domain-containing protein [Actinomycetota bacterium]
LDPTSIAWEDASLAGIPFESLPEGNPTTLITYRLSYEVPCVDSAEMDALVELPDGFRYRPGSSTASVNNSPAPIGDPTIDQDGALTWDLSAFACTGPTLRTIEIEFKAMPGLDVGTGFSASASVVSANTSALLQQAAPVDVVSGFGGNGTPSQAAGVSTNSLVFGHLPNPGDQAFFEFSADPGDQISVSLSHLSHDYDLVLYAPSGAETASALRATTPVEVPLGKGPLADPLAGAGSEELLVPEALQDLPLVSDRVVAGISDFRGTEQEFVTTTGVAGTGDTTYLVQVSQNNADHGPEPFVLTIRTTTPDALPACSARTFPNASTIPALPLPTVTTSDNTLIVVDSARLEAAYGTVDAATIMTKLGALAGADDAGVSGQVLDLAAVPAVNAAFSSLDGDPCSPAHNNTVVRAINDAVDSLNGGTSTLSGVQNIVLIGDDALLPHARIADGTTDGNEREFAGDTYFTGTTNALGGAFGNGYFLSDAPYGSLRPLSILRQTIYPMQVATGRLGGSASTISDSIQRFIDSDGIADPRTATTDPRTALETDYDFFRDGGDLIHQSHQSHVGSNGTAEQLSDGTTPWSKADLTSKLINDTGSGANPPHLISPNAHYDQYRLLPAEQDANGSWQASELLTTADIHGLAGTPYHLRLVYGIGCHFGLDFPDALAGSNPSAEDAARVLDWPQTYLDKGAAVLVGNLGFGFGDTATVAFSERLMANFAANLDDTATVGEALVKAEKDYLTSLASISPYDLKVLQQTIMWGLPMYAMPGSSGGGGSGPTAPNPTPLIGNVDATTVTVAPAFHQSSAPGGTSFFDIGGLTQATHPYPIVPKVVTDLPTDGQKLAKGAFLNAGTITEQSFTNAYTNATIDQSALEPATPFPTIYPTTYQSIGTSVDRNGNAAQTFVLVPGQFRSGTNALQPNVGTFRKLTTSTWTVTYGPSSDVTGPTFVSIDGAPSATATTFTVELRGAENDDAVVQVRVAALFVGDGDYHVVDLTLDSGSSNSGTWTGTLPNNNVREFTVFALDSEGNVSTANNRGRAYAPQDDEDAAITRSIGQPSFEIDGDTYVTSSTPITVTVNDAGTGIDHCEIDILGPVSVPSPACGAGDNEFTLPGTDGAYAIQVSATDNNGNESSLAFDLVVDTSGPTFGTCPTPEFVVLNQNGGSISYSVTADDGIGLGAGPVLTQTLNTTTVGLKTLTFTAVDTLGNQATLNCTVGVRYNFTGFQSPTDNPPTVNSAKAGQSVPVKFRLTDATGAPVTAPVSFAAANWKVTSVATTASCSGTADAIETYAGTSGWQSLGNGVYQFNWATPTSYKNQCRTMRLDLADGTAQSPTAGVAHVALFRFVK